MRVNQAGAEDLLVANAVANAKDTRTFPRAAVWAGVVSLFGYMIIRKATKAETAMADRKRVINQVVPPRPSDPVRKFSKAVPIAMNARKYETLTKKGLGVDSYEA